MKKYILLGFVIYTALSMFSFSTGFGVPATGAPGESGASCGQGGCHASGTFSPELSFTLTDGAGEAVTNYVAGQEYTISLKINHTGLPSGYGFQMVCLDASENSVSTFSDLPAGVQERMALDRQYIEQASPSPVDSIPLKWTAPDNGQGPVTFYAIGNAVDGNSSPTGDGAARGTFTVDENVLSTNDLADIKLKVFPNPSYDVINVPVEIKVKEMQLLDISGKTIQTTSSNSMNVANLESGQYLIKVLDNNNKIYTEQIQKI